MKENKFIISTEVLRPALKKLTPCMSKDETRYYLCSMFLKFDGSDLIIVATDGHKLGRILLTIESQDEFPSLTPFEVIIPSQSIPILLKSLPKESRVIVTVKKEKILFDWSFANYEANLLDASYPDFEKVRAKTTHDGITICFNADYLKKLAATFDGGLVLYINRDTSLPVLIEDTDRKGVEFTLMPRKI